MNEQDSKFEEIMSDDIKVDNDIITDNGIISSEIPIVEEHNDVLVLPSGEALDIKETYKITAKEDTKLIVLVGPSSCGKTTIIAAVYQMFLRSPVEQLFFAGSKTLLGYEQRSYYSRFSTNPNEPMTWRTSGGVSNSFLHLRLWDSKQNTFINFLLADISGEDYERYTNNVDAVREHLGFIKYADYIVSVLDGELILDNSKRNGLTNDMAQLLQTIVDSNLTSKYTKLQVLFSKYDAIDNLEKAASNEYIDYCKNVYQERFKPQFADFEFYNVAAMPKNGDKYDFGSGIEELIFSWSKQDNIVEDTSPMAVAVNNEFNKLYYKLTGA